ncbi:TRAP transporter substrate-binding protein DctP [Paraburkholderia sabiae]|uniref:TRAP transporter substrate-binding protein DctP n=1 Tax=Paraburkholderia sabiae TaxID=273251 RepID=A0ABU9QS28_9BURK|nr:TRAP transporter substrate-binding protein DctP [Paraburkholderia sabiae]WJZ79648.1 TRAP transporter substrate-binding protein DctP [Paraburkholderia sabiae]CAD6562873.1 hypothetical protein LMG24235_08115 [Paraburkholderia sabiae]
MVTAYPQDTVSGNSLRVFAERAAIETRGYVGPHLQYRSHRGTGQLLLDVQSGRVDVADVFGGDLAVLDPLFELSTLPFLAQNEAEASTLECLAEIEYRRALASAGLHLLVMSPWPPTGLWSRKPISSIRDVVDLKIRTYDQASASVFANMGAHAVSLPMGDMKRLVRTGNINAVLSSGDGAVGDTLAGMLPNFADVRYAFPVSLLLMSEERFRALPAEVQQQLTSASRAAQKAQWQALPERMETNYARMRENGVSVQDPITVDLHAALEREGQARALEWSGRVRPAVRAVLAAYRNRAAAVGNECRRSLGDDFNGGLG